MCCNHFGAVAAEGAAGQSWGEQSKSKGGAEWSGNAAMLGGVEELTGG